MNFSRLLQRYKNKFRNTTIRKRILFLLFSIVIVLPTFVVGWGVYFYYIYGIEPLLSTQIKDSINETVQVAEAYLEEHKENIKYDVMAMANEIQVDRNFFLLLQSPDLLEKLLTMQATQRGLSEALIFTRTSMIASSRGPLAVLYKSFPTQDLALANSKEALLLEQTAGEDRVRVLLKLDKFMDDTYLVIGRDIDPQISDYMRNTKGSADLYNMKLDYLHSIKLKMFLFLLATLLFIVFITVFFGFKLAKLLSGPLDELFQATNKIQRGDYSVRMNDSSGSNEIKALFRAFNQMTETIEKQRDDLLTTNDMITEKADFIENILSKIASGVITLDEKKKIILINNYALRLLNRKSSRLIGKSYKIVLPKVEESLELASKTKKAVTGSMVASNLEGRTLNLNFTILPVLNRNVLDSFILTFDDMTDHLAVEKLKAWSDVSRRIAHEIKNPLTPVALSAERLGKKFGKYIYENKAQYDKYIKTITNHVDDIRRIVEDFVLFAQLPTPRLAPENILEIIESNIFVNNAEDSTISCKVVAKKGETYIIPCDKNLISQAFTNILKNAKESIEAKYKVLSAQGKSPQKGLIKITLRRQDKKVRIVFEDNGLGFPKELIETVTEPYVTTKPTGTGIGLAVVKKVIDDHEGEFYIENTDAGARIIIVL